MVINELPNFKKSIIALIIITIISSAPTSAFLISDQGTNVRDVATGNLTELANLTISIYDNQTLGTLIFEQNFSDAIVNGSWNLMINPSLEYGKKYYKDYQINGEDLDFDGNERLEFQSSVGSVNNVSFINFSLINSCQTGSSIRLIHENGSVECQTDENSESINLTNYALKNQSETFTGNITTPHSGFFKRLGSMSSRITKLFIQDIDFNGTLQGAGNINTTGNITSTYFIGDGSLLSNLPSASGDNTSWNQSYADTLYYPVSNPFSFWNDTHATFNKSYADTLYAGLEWNYNQTVLSNTYTDEQDIIFNDSIKDYVESYVNSNGADNASFNQSLTDSLYIAQDDEANLNGNSSVWWASVSGWTQEWFTNNAGNLELNGTKLNESIDARSSDTTYSHLTNFTDDLGNRGYTALSNFTNDQDFINSTQAQDYNETNYIDTTISNNNESWTSTYNATYDALVTDNSSWNQSYADTLYAGIEWGYNQTESSNSYSDSIIAINNASWSTTYNTTYNSYNSTGLIRDWNSTELLINWSTPETDSLAYNGTLTYLSDLIAWNYYNASNPQPELDPKWSSNFSLYNISWTSTYNATYDALVTDNSSWNQSFADALYSNIIWGYNQTIPAQNYVDSQLTNYIPSGTANMWILQYQNISNIPTCTGNDKLTFDGTTLSCATDQAGAGSADGTGGWTNSTTQTNTSLEVNIAGNISSQGYVSRYGFYYAYRSSEFNNAAADSFTLVDLDTVSIADAPFYSESAGTLSIGTSGLYKIDSTCTFDLDSGTREDGQCAIFVNGAIRADLTCSAYMRENARIGTSCSNHGILSLSATDTIDLRMRGDTANVDLGGGIVDTDPATMRLEFIRAS